MPQKKSDGADKVVVDEEVNAAWNSLLDHYRARGSRKKYPNNVQAILGLSGTDRAPLALVCDAILARVYPPPEALTSITISFMKYMEAKGKLSLEEAFFGRSVQKSGPYSQRQSKANKNEAEELLLGYIVKVKKVSIGKAAEIVSDKMKANSNGPETLKRRIRASKKMASRGQ